MLVRGGWTVRVIATTASEAAREADPQSRLGSLKIQTARIVPGRLGGNWFEFSHRGVQYRLLNTGSQTVDESRRMSVDEIDVIVAEELDTRIPDVLLTYGSSEAEVRRRALARQTGSRVVFSVRNLAYLHPRAFESVDAIIGPSRYVSDFYRQQLGVCVTPLPQPISVDDVVARVHCPTFLTFINPTPEKGVRFFLRIVQENVVRGLNLPFLVVESRGSSGLLVAIAKSMGLDVGALATLCVTKNTANPSSIYAATKILLMPSLSEAAGRCVVEAQLNRIPVIASDRGGLPETVGNGGFVSPISEEDAAPDRDAKVGAWLDIITRLVHDPDSYERASQSAYSAVSPYWNGDVERERVTYFHSLVS